MFDYFEGKIVEGGPTSIVLETGGIGYRFQVSLGSGEAFPAGSNARVYAHLYVRESEQRLFGFSTRGERALFRLLLTVSGVGPALALKILSGCAYRELRRAILGGDLERLQGIRGVGAKTAQRILVDLREAIRTTIADLDGGEEGATADSGAWEDALLALLALGYNRAASEKALQRAREGSDRATTAQVLVRAALRFL